MNIDVVLACVGLLLFGAGSMGALLIQQEDSPDKKVKAPTSGRVLAYVLVGFVLVIYSSWGG